MLPIDTENFGAIYPIKFTSPLPIAECRNRLQQSLGKAMGDIFTTIEGEVEMVNETTCKFRVYQNVAKGGMRTIVGYLYAQSNSSTLVDAIFGLDRQSQQEFYYVAIMMGIFTVIWASFQQFICAGVFLLLLGFILYVGWRNRTNPPRPPRNFKKEPMSQLLWWFERTLKN